MKPITHYFKRIPKNPEVTQVGQEAFDNDNNDPIKSEPRIILPPIVCFTDGSFVSSSKVKIAGYSCVFPDNQEATYSSRLEGKLTNNRAEFTALIKALEIADLIDEEKKRHLVLYTDSELLVNTVNKWISGWKRNGWRRADKKPVKNVDLIIIIDQLIAKRVTIVRHVRAHTGKNDYFSKWNDVADKLAKNPVCR